MKKKCSHSFDYNPNCTWMDDLRRIHFISKLSVRISWIAIEIVSVQPITIHESQEHSKGSILQRRTYNGKVDGVLFYDVWQFPNARGPDHK